MPRKEYISPAVIHRLPRYYRYLNIFESEGIERISSKELANRMGLTSSQIRQDLNHFGGFGQQGYGYNVVDLKTEIASIMGLNQGFTAIIIGIGNLGKAVAKYMTNAENGFEIIGYFDKNPTLIGTELLGKKVESINCLEKFFKTNKPSTAILCINAPDAKEIVKFLYNHDVKSFLNFSSYDIGIDYLDVQVENVHLRDSLMSLSYKIADERI